MANLAINELSAKAPISTDLIPVADPSTGIAGKSTTNQLSNFQLNSSISYSSTGNLITPPAFIICKPATTQVGVDKGLEYSGKWAILCNYIFLGATSITFNDIEGLYSNGITFGSENTTITSISFPALKQIITAGNGNSSYNWNGVPNLTTILFPELEYAFSIGLYFSNCPLLSNLNFSKLKYSGLIFISSCQSISSISFPELERIDVSLNSSGSISIQTNMNSLSSLSFPKLKLIISSKSTDSIFFSFGSSATVKQILFPKLEIATGRIRISNSNQVETISFPEIVEIDSCESTASASAISITGVMTNLTSFTLGSTLKKVGSSTGGDVLINTGSLDQSSVDNILIRLAYLDGANGTTAYSNRTVTITGLSSAPSAAGLAAKSTLIARGCTVTTN